MLFFNFLFVGEHCDMRQQLQNWNSFSQVKKIRSWMKFEEMANCWNLNQKKKNLFLLLTINMTQYWIKLLIKYFFNKYTHTHTRTQTYTLRTSVSIYKCEQFFQSACKVLNLKRSTNNEIARCFLRRTFFLELRDYCN